VQAMLLWQEGDAVTRVTAVLLLVMSIATWVILLLKLRLMHRARVDVARCTAAFWQAPDWSSALQRLTAWDRERLVLPLVVAVQAVAQPVGLATLAQAGSLQQQLTRVLRDALHHILARLQSGQVLLATVGSTAPFVGLLGTVWGVYRALSALSGGGALTMDQIAGPVGEALVMTAAGLAVAIPAVLAYNILGRAIAAVEADLEGFARDVRELVVDTPAATGSRVEAAVAGALIESPASATSPSLPV
jgi:biopolymer transport protein ExbB